MHTNGSTFVQNNNSDRQPISGTVSFNNAPKELIQKILADVTIATWITSKPHQVSRQWNEYTEELVAFFRNVAFGSNRWNARYPKLWMLPPSILPPNIDSLINLPCPFNKTKRFVDTHVITYIGEDFKVLKNDTTSILYNSIENIHQIFGRNTRFCLYNVNPNSNVEKTKQGPRWIALYKGALYVYRKNGRNIEPSGEEKANEEIAIENGYQEPSVFELGFPIFTASMALGGKCETWLSKGGETEKRMIICIDTLKYAEKEDEEISIYGESDGFGISTQCSSVDWLTSRHWNVNGAFGKMVCKELK